MSIKVKDSIGTWRTVTQPWIKVNNAQRAATKVYTKVGGTWMEAWPLQPGAPGAPITTTTYRNDRIEVDVSWTAPTTGEPTARYFITLVIPGVWSTTVQVNAPSVALTYTNNGSGFQHLAGYGIYSTVYAQSAAGRNSDTTTGASTPIVQMPPPPQPTSYSVTMWQCALHHSWSHPGGNRITGVEMHIYHNSNGGAASYNATTFEADYQSWNTSTIGGGQVSCYLRTTGPGGVSNWVSVGGEMPNPVNTWAYRWGDNYLRVATSGISPAVQVHTLPNGGGYSHVANFAAGAGEVYDPGSPNYARNHTYWGMLLRPINTANGWVGRDQWMGWVKKIPWPMQITPIDSATWRGPGWRGEQDQDYQGATRDGHNVAFFFYGNQIYDYMSAANVGFDIGITSAYIILWRYPTGGLNRPISPQLMLHRAGWVGDDFTWGGDFATTALSRDQAAWCVVPNDWAYALKERHDGWRGLGIYHGNAFLVASNGYISDEYMPIRSWNNGIIEGDWLDALRIYHNG